MQKWTYLLHNYKESLKRIRSLFKEVVLLMFKDKVSLIGLSILLIFIFAGIIGPLVISPPEPSPQIYAPPSLKHPFGTDFQGEDIFSLIIYGTPFMLLTAFIVSAVTTLISVILGTVAGYIGKLADTLIMGAADIMLAIPQLPLLLILAVLIKSMNIITLSLLISALSWPTAARAFRSQILSLKERDFVESSRLLGFNSVEIIVYDLIPNILPYIAINLILNAIYAIYIVASLAYLGFIPFSSANWGVMLYQAWAFGTIYNRQTFMYVMAPIMAIVMLQVGLMLFSRAFEVIFNPRVRSGE
ncbi:MAG: ABC transporter permease [Sulfolobus sp.]|nr:ABC transporter permease [Sulfolobus sp.]